MVGSMLCALPGAAAAPGAWAQFGVNSQHTSYSADPSITAGGASSMGVHWMANMFSASLSSPVAAFNATLNKTVAYMGNERGDVFAVDASNGQLLWSTNLGVGDAIRSTPGIAPDGTLWVGTAYNPAIYKLNAATGAVICSVKTGAIIDGSMMFATPPGGVQTVYVTTNNNISGPGPVFAMNESNCSTEFTFTKFVNPDASSWTTPAFFVDAAGEPMIVFGTTDPDQHAYAIDAKTGALVWTFFPTVGPGTWDLGAGPTIGSKGLNGFPNGVVYLQTKYGVEYANDESTGNMIWSYSMFPSGYKGARDARSSAALDRNNLVFGFQGGVDDIDAGKGTLIWQYATPLEVVSSPAIAGTRGSEVVAFGDIMGTFHVLGLNNGAQLYKYQTGGYITSSPAVINGNILINSSDGFLYSYAVGGSNSTAPATAISSPANTSTVANPNGNLTVTGTSTDATGVSSVEVAIQQNGSTGPWYSTATGTYGSAPFRNLATLASPGATSTTWTYQFPAPAGGGSFQAFVNTANNGHVVDKGALSSFTILPSKIEPNLSLSTQYAQPGGGFSVIGHSFSVGEKVAFSLFGQVVATVSTIAGTGRTPSVRINLAPTAAFGPTGVTATGLTSGKVSTAVVGITNEWTQLGYSSSRTSFESNDSVLVKILDIGKGTVLDKSWSYSTGAAVNTSPAVVNGTAFVGNDAGVLKAIIVNSGAALWSYSIPSHAPIRSSPAIDPAGNVVFGANDGNLYVLSPTGQLLKTLALGGNLNSVALNNGQIYVSSDNGNLYDVSDPAATLVWTKALGHASHSAPAYDPAQNIVIVGDDGGGITALDSTTGAQKWSVSTGGPVTGSPGIFGGNIIIGSMDGNLYSLSETTGAVKWKFAADSGISSGVSINGLGTISFGTQKGTLYLVSSAGVQDYAQPGIYKGVIVGVSALENNVVAETSTGFVGVTRLDAGAAQYPLFTWQLGPGGASSSPAIIDGAVYITAGDGNLYAFTPHGSNPIPAVSRGPVITITDAWTCTTP